MKSRLALIAVLVFLSCNKSSTVEPSETVETIHEGFGSFGSTIELLLPPREVYPYIDWPIISFGPYDLTYFKKVYVAFDAVSLTQDSADISFQIYLIYISAKVGSSVQSFSKTIKDFEFAPASSYTNVFLRFYLHSGKVRLSNFKVSGVKK